jgi:hypothetical protein
MYDDPPFKSRRPVYEEVQAARQVVAENIEKDEAGGDE